VFCYQVMPFGLKNAGATYQRMMQNCLGSWWLVSTARWEPQEEGMMSTVASLPSVMKPRFNRTSRRTPNFRRWCLLALWHSRQWRQIQLLVGVSSPSSNAKPAQHKQVLCSQLTMRLSISPVWCIQRIERIER
jgi:hypothetical protein